jgi:hypothetical protein
MLNRTLISRRARRGLGERLKPEDCTKLSMVSVGIGKRIEECEMIIRSGAEY